jgi:hypothetical protein
MKMKDGDTLDVTADANRIVLTPEGADEIVEFWQI